MRYRFLNPVAQPGAPRKHGDHSRRCANKQIFSGPARFDQADINALEAISIIGALTDSRANPKGVIVLREYDARQVRSDMSGPSMPQVVFTFDLTSADGLFAARGFRINPKDTVLATGSPATGVQTVVGLLGSMLGLAGRLNTF